MSNREIRNHPKIRNVFISGRPNRFKLYTKNLVPGNKVYGERLITSNDIEYRTWDPFKSKLAAILLDNPASELLSKADMKWLYLGASSGTTISHLSDILDKGIIYGVEFAERSIRQLIQNITKRTNIIPILGDARHPSTYSRYIFTEIDLIYQDVAQPNQAEIAIANASYYLKKGGLFILSIKSQSIDSISKSEKIYAQERKKIELAGYLVRESINIDRYAANHIVLICQKKRT